MFSFESKERQIVRWFLRRMHSTTVTKIAASWQTTSVISNACLVRSCHALHFPWSCCVHDRSRPPGGYHLLNQASHVFGTYIFLNPKIKAFLTSEQHIYLNPKDFDPLSVQTFRSNKGSGRCDICSAVCRWKPPATKCFSLMNSGSLLTISGG